MCGIIGIVGQSDVASALYDGLTVLQHRGQDAAGIATIDGSRVQLHKGNGLVADVFETADVNLLTGRVGIGHCRYPTAGSSGSDEAQPFYVNSPWGIALAHNGNLINMDALRREVFEQDPPPRQHRLDSEVLLNVFAHELREQGALTPQAALAAVAGTHRRVKGGYAIVGLVLGLGLFAFRDPNGIARWCWASARPRPGPEYAVAPNRGARHPRFHPRARRRAGRGGGGHRPRRAVHRAGRRRRPSTRPASSSTCTSRAPTR
jgi:amidophosphoribosyltransferase